MMGVLFGPILTREIRTNPRRPRHYALRASFALGLLILLWTAWQRLVGFQLEFRPGDFAHFVASIAPLLLYTQLALLLFAAALLGAASITQEKDRRTLTLLLVTRLPSLEIVGDKFLATMLQVVTLLAASAPLLFLLLPLGGLSAWEIVESYTITFAATLAAAALGVMLAAWREKTYQAVALSILGIAGGLLLVEGLALLAPAAWGGQWASAINPFRAIHACVGHSPHSWHFRGSETVAAGLPMGLRPSIWSAAVLMLVAIAQIAWAAFRLRAWNPRGEPIETGEEAPAKTEGFSSPAFDSRERPHIWLKRRRPQREIWDNPVLWREIRTRAYGTKAVLIKLTYLAIAVLLGWTLFSVAGQPAGRFTHVATGAPILLVSVLSLLLINAQSVTSITSERDLGALDLLLVTEITPAEFLLGKLMGIVYNTREMILLPPILMLLAGWLGLLTPIGALFGTLAWLVLVAFAAVLGIHSALRHDTTKLAIANSLGTMFLLSAGILLCLWLILAAGDFQAQWASFLVFIVMGSVGLWISLSANAPSNAIAVTATMMPFATFYCVVAFLVGDRGGPFLVAVAVYGFAVASLLVPLVSEFDVATGRTTAQEG